MNLNSHSMLSLQSLSICGLVEPVMKNLASPLSNLYSLLCEDTNTAATLEFIHCNANTSLKTHNHSLKYGIFCAVPIQTLYVILSIALKISLWESVLRGSKEQFTYVSLYNNTIPLQLHNPILMACDKFLLWNAVVKLEEIKTRETREKQQKNIYNKIK